MAKWVTKEIVKDLKEILGGKYRISNDGQGGDVDTDNLYIKVNKEDHIHVRGFSPNVNGVYVTTPSNCDVTHVEVTDGKDSSGGLSSYELDTAWVYAIVRKYFDSKGFFVVDCLKDYY